MPLAIATLLVSGLTLQSQLSRPQVMARSATPTVMARSTTPTLAVPTSTSRRDAVLGAAAAATALASLPSGAAAADSPATVVVAGATGQTGRRILEKLASQGGLSVIGAVRNTDKAKKALGEASVTVRGAMVQTVPSVDTSAVTLAKLDVVKVGTPGVQPQISCQLRQLGAPL